MVLICGQNAGMAADFKGGMPSDVAELVSYIAKPEAWYVTGAFDSDDPTLSCTQCNMETCS